MEDRQLVFPFILEDNKMNCKTCVSCSKQEECVNDGVGISIEHTCGEWEYDHHSAQEFDSEECKEEYEEYMDKYDISEHDRKAIYVRANLF